MSDKKDIGGNDKPVAKTTKKSTPEFDWEIGVIVILLLLIVALPIAISVWDIGTPIKGYSV